MTCFCKSRCLNNSVVAYFFQMSGLDIEKEHILEMACLITDEDLNIIAEVQLQLVLYLLQIHVKRPISISFNKF